MRNGGGHGSAPQSTLSGLGRVPGLPALSSAPWPHLRTSHSFWSPAWMARIPEGESLALALKKIKEIKKYNSLG